MIVKLFFKKDNKNKKKSVLELKNDDYINYAKIAYDVNSLTSICFRSRKGKQIVCETMFEGNNSEE